VGKGTAELKERKMRRAVVRLVPSRPGRALRLVGEGTDGTRDQGGIQKRLDKKNCFRTSAQMPLHSSGRRSPIKVQGGVKASTRYVPEKTLY